MFLKPVQLFKLPPKVFISYSHADRDFVEKLATDLIKNRILVWWDEWEIKVGDSLIRKIDEGISTSSYLVIVLSANSVDSAWVQEELRAALMLQLDEKKTIVLPILLDDCRIPLFLREKNYADFRKDYLNSLRRLINAIKSPSIEATGRKEIKEYFNDYALDWGMIGDRYALIIKITSHSPKLSYAIFCEVTAVSNKKLSTRLQQYFDSGFSWAIPSLLLGSIQDFISKSSPTVLIEGDKETKEKIIILDPKIDMGVELEIKTRRLGTDPGSDILYEWGSTFLFLMQEHIKAVQVEVSPSDQEKFREWLRKKFFI